MSSLTRCISLHGQGLSDYEIDYLKKSAKAYVDEGFDAKTANINATKDILADLDKEYDDITDQVNKFKGIEPEKAKETPAPSPAEEAKAKVLKVGDNLRIMKTDAIVAKSMTIDGIEYDLFNASKLKDNRGFIRVYDQESGNVISVTEYPTYDAAESKYLKDIKTTQKIEAPSEEAKAKEGSVYLPDSSPRGGFVEKPVSYLRFGRPPEGNKPSINWITKKPEKGVSTYRGWYDEHTGKFVLESADSDTVSTQGELIGSATEKGKKLYLINGTEITDVGEDFETLLNPKSVKIIREISLDEVVSSEDPWMTISGKELSGDEIPNWMTPSITKPELQAKQAEAEKPIPTPETPAELAETTPKREEEGVKKAIEVAPSRKLADWVQGEIKSRKQITWQDLFRQADVFFEGTQAEGKYTPKDAYDAVELGVNQFIAGSIITDPSMDALDYTENQVMALKDLIKLLPTQSKRTEETDEFQQFSTPPPFAYAVAWAANINENDIVLEPSAGTGNIAIMAKNAKANKVIVNELSDRRLALLKELEFDQYFNEDATQINNILPKDIKPTVIVMNPPFSSTAGRIQGRRDTMEGARHIEQALSRLEPNGRLVAIVGRGMADDMPAFKDWWTKIKGQYAVKVNIRVHGKEYHKYGTYFDNQLLVIDKTDEKDYNVIKGKVDSVEDLLPLIIGVRNDRISQREREQVEPTGERPLETGRREPGEGISVLPPTGEVGGGRGVGGRITVGVRGKPGRATLPVEPEQGYEVPGGRTQSIERPTEESEAARPGRGRIESTGQQIEREGARISEAERVTGELQIETKQKEIATGEITEDLYEGYKPERLEIPGSKRHPTPLVQSAAMASVSSPKPTYKPNLPQKIINEGKVSDAQLEFVVYAGQAHEDFLPNGSRRGIFIGDGTGVGKGREIAAIMWDNWNKGRKKAIWISEKKSLINDAKRDIEGTGWDPSKVIDHGKIKADGVIKSSTGILFTTYDTLKSKSKDEKSKQSRLQQILDWLGPDFDGVIALDESHNMGNAIAVRAERGLKQPAAKALAGVDFQRQLPKARVLYVSATGATEVMNLAYADRLGLWGEGTPFPNKETFIQDISSGGIAAMELVARDMKSMGMYNARSLSYDGVEQDIVEHKLTTEQKALYNKLAEAWQTVLRNINEALKAIGAVSERGRTLNKNAKSAAYSAFWGAHQRFFNQIVTAMQMTTVLKAAQQDLAKNESVIFQLTSTMEAAQERALAKLSDEESLEDLDLTPRDCIMQLVEKSFPVAQYEERTDDNGNVISVIVLDSKGNPVENAEAVAMRDRLLDQLGAVRVPDSPLDMIIEEFGSTNVAEVTGRKRRVVRKQTDKGIARVIEKRSMVKASADAMSFMNDKKKVLVFSEAGGTGRSYHADLDSKNQRKRNHYLLQAGWRADKAVQGLGRTHRSNQKQPPKYILVTTDLKGQKRFISSIARRLDQLGALTKGERKTGGQGLFSAKDNLENDYARDALRQFYEDLYRHRIEDLTVKDFENQTGLKISDDKGNMVQQLPPIRQFLNRLLSMSVETQDFVFDAYSERLDRVIQGHVEAGDLDLGLETLKADKIEKVKEETVHTDERSGSETKYVQLDVTDKAPILEYDIAKNNYAKDGFYRNIKSQKIWAAITRTITNKYTGGLEDVHDLTSTSYHKNRVEADDFTPDKWEKVPDSEAKALWDEAVKNTPTTHTKREHLITGLVLPIWDRLHGHTRIMRVQTNEGERMIGRIIPSGELATTLRNIGAEAGKIKITPNEIYTQVLDQGYTINLANDWTIVRRKVSGEDRIELQGPDYADLDVIRNYGVFTERIQYTTRYFIPVSKDEGIKAIKSIIKNSPVVSVDVPMGYKGTEEEPAPLYARATGKPKNFQGITLNDIRGIFKGQTVSLAPDGSVRVMTKKGQGLSIKSVNIISENAMAFQVAYGKARANGEFIAGKYVDGEIEVQRDIGDKWTIRHESVHWLEDAGIINYYDIAILKNHIRKLVRQGKLETQNKKDIGGSEDRAVFISESIQKRQEARGVERVLQKIRDFIDSLVNLVTKTPSGIIREVETGRIYERGIKETKPRGPPAYMLAGKGANIAPVSNISKSEEMYAAGKSDDEVWKETGWMKEPSGKWTFRIDDSKAKLKIKDVSEIGTKTKLSDILDHPELFNAYFMLEDLPVKHDPFLDAAGECRTGRMILKQLSLKTVLHEVQHAVQEIEGFAVGGGPESFGPIDIIDYGVKHKLQTPIESLNKMYRNLTGEISSREADAGFTGTPFTMEGIPRDQWIVRDSEKGTSFSVESPEKQISYQVKKVISQNPEIQAALQKLNEVQGYKVDRIVRDAPAIVRESKGYLKERFGKGYTDADMWRLKSTYVLPYWLAKKYKSMDALVQEEIRASEKRSSEVFRDYEGELGDIQSSIPRDKVKYKALQDIIWRYEGKRFDKKDVPTNWHKPLKEGEDVEINPKHYEEVEAYLTKQRIDPEVIDAFITIRKKLDEKWADVDKTLRSNKLDPTLIDEYRSKMGEIHNYFPHRRTGNSYVLIQKVGEKDPDKKTVYREHYNSFKDRTLPIKEKARVRAENWIKEAIRTGKLEGNPSDYNIELGPVKALPDEIFFQIPIENMQQVLDVAGRSLERARVGYEAQRLYTKEGRTEEEALELAKKRLHADMERALSQAVSEVLKSRGFGRHAMLRKGIPGHETEDIFGIMFDYLNGYAGFKTKIERARHHHKVLHDIPAKQRSNEWRYASRYVRDVLANQDHVDRLVDGLRGMFYVKYLGFVPKSAIINLSQNVVLAAPTLSVHTKGGLFRAERLIVAAMKDTRRSLTSKEAWTQKGEVKYSNLTADEQKALHEMIETGTTTDLFLRELQGSLPAKGWAKYFNKVIRKAGLFMQIAEKWNRASTGLAAYRVGIKEKGMNHDEAVKFAKQIIYDSHFLYGKSNLPELMRGGDIQKILRSGYTFRSFTHNYLHAMAHLATNQGIEGKKAFFRSLRNLFLMGGLTSVPFFKAFAEALMWAIGDDDEDAITMARAAMPQDWLKDLVTYGLPGVTGIDLTGSLSIEIPRNWQDIIGVPYAIIEDSVNMIDGLKSGQIFRSISETPFTPISLRNAMRGLELYTKGQRTRSGVDINYPGEVGPRKISGVEAIAKSLGGFQPTTISKGYGAYQASERLQESVQQRKTKWADRFVNALKDGNIEERNHVINEVREWNAKAREEGKTYLIIDIDSAVKYRMRPNIQGIPKNLRTKVKELSETWQ